METFVAFFVLQLNVELPPVLIDFGLAVNVIVGAVAAIANELPAIASVTICRREKKAEYFWPGNRMVENSSLIQRSRMFVRLSRRALNFQTCRAAFILSL
jgi:hypothetical protein